MKFSPIFHLSPTSTQKVRGILQLDLRRNATRCMHIIADSAENFKCFLTRSFGVRIIKATPHNSASRFDERFFVKVRFEKRGNTVCISNFSNCRIGRKDPSKREGAIVRCCLKIQENANGWLLRSEKSLKRNQILMKNFLIFVLYKP